MSPKHAQKSKRARKENVDTEPALQKKNVNKASNGKKATTKTTSPRDKDLEKEIENLKKLLAEAKRDALKANEPLKETIPKPKGSPGSIADGGYCLIDEMRLSDTEDGIAQYAMIRRTMHDIALRGNINLEVPYGKQTPECLAKMFKAARERFPILGRYQGDWATAAFVKQYVNNRRKHEARKAARARGTHTSNSGGNGPPPPSGGAGGSIRAPVRVSKTIEDLDDEEYEEEVSEGSNKRKRAVAIENSEEEEQEDDEEEDDDEAA
ncbi:hypothetical protein BV25DRAFT_1903872 [Artomyces pyxidatus]|uniref:Uncharacterized protein n=1 Tax=Artomyces pyxidatus TaxID=48021 RepID=A0ACB8SE19_9AGAM|nr:hypothetical protein BV25DRAFT_1903872 [Artomyces pyxidatus]